MTASAPPFAFPADTIAFLDELRSHNTKAWFEANRGRYQTAYVEAAKAFVHAVTPILEAIVPGITAEPRVLGSIFRIHRDTRFSPDKRPYKDHLDLWFWEGDRKTAVSGLFVRVSPETVGVGAGSHSFDKIALAAFRRAVADTHTGAEVAHIVAGIEAAGYELGGQSYSRVPRGYPAEGPAARFLRHSAMFVHHDESPELALDHERLLPTLTRHWTALAPLHRWLLAHLQQT